jgi:hypothetical protein
VSGVGVFGDMEPYAQGLFNHWYRTKVFRKTAIWWGIWSLILWVVAYYVVWAIFRANHWYAPYLDHSNAPTWSFLLLCVAYAAPPFAGYVMAKLTVYWLHRSGIQNSFDKEFSIVFDDMETLNAADMKAKIDGVTKEQKAIMRDELERRLSSFV